MDLNELMSGERWLEFGQDFCDHSGLNAFAFDDAGEHIPGKGKWANPLCPVLRGRQDRAEQVCIKAYQTVANAARQDKQIVVDKCAAGMLVLGVPIFLGGEYIGLVGGCGRLPSDAGIDKDALLRLGGMEEGLVERLAKDVGQISRYDAETWIRYLEDRARERWWSATSAAWPPLPPSRPSRTSSPRCSARACATSAAAASPSARP